MRRLISANVNVEAAKCAKCEKAADVTLLKNHEIVHLCDDHHIEDIRDQYQAVVNSIVAENDTELAKVRAALAAREAEVGRLRGFLEEIARVNYHWRPAIAAVLADPTA